jgi:hypothetical protein
LSLDPDQQLLVEHPQDALQDWNCRDVLTALELGDERVRGPGPLGDLLLGEL